MASFNKNDINFDFVDEYIKQHQEKKEITSKKDYWDWLAIYLENHEIVCDDEIDDINKELLSYFFEYICELGIEQSVFSQYEDMSETIYFQYKKSQFYKIECISGQGTLTTIQKIDKIPEEFVILNKEFTEEEKKEFELVEYIIINKDLKLSIGKTAVSAAHASQLCTEQEQNNMNYQTWKKKYFFKKILLQAHEKDMLKLEQENKFYCVRDCGFTEVEPNSLTAISLGILSRKKAKPYIKRFQLLK